MKYLNERLKEAFELRGMTPTNLAHRIGVQGGYISKLLSGKISNTKHIGAISECLNVNIAWLKSGDGLPVVGIETHYVDIPLYTSVNEYSKKSYMKMARIPYLYADKDNDLFAISLSQNDLFEEGATMVVNKHGKGNGFFLIEDNKELFISSRFDNMNSLNWVHNTNKKSIVINTAKILGKIVAFYEQPYSIHV
ncbi:helix-turn-helix transcriptional regulator [Photorhabdus sp. P32]|uniref:helix-turn-helix domain-containing protein n=1 Tax=Photorhabdus sp. P32 TaxID=3117549 RepID=UPI00311AFE14